MTSVHSIVDIPIAQGGPGSSLPFLFLQSGELSLFALAWARQKMLDTQVGPASLSKGVHAIGRFYDFYMQEKGGASLSPNELHLMLKQYYEARRFGLPSLGWVAVKASTAADDIRHITDFTDWCSVNFGHTQANPEETVLVRNLNLAEQQRYFAQENVRKRWDFLYHLSPAQSTDGAVAITRRKFTPTKSARRGAADHKYFPPERAWHMITAAPSVRDKLYLLLLFFGGVRISEPLHIFASDVAIQADGTARVVLAHPQDGAYEWPGVDGKRKHGKRAQYLAERYSRGPRNLLAASHPLHAGWKGMMQDDGKRAESVVHWLREDASRLFAKLHAEYIKTTRCKIPDNHPYYFVSERDGDSYGQPLKLSNVTKMFYRTAARIGLNVQDAGVNPHGARHFFGFYCASVLRLNVEVTQKLMHHSSMLSTEVYYALSNDAVNKELSAAQSRLDVESPALLAAPLTPLLTK